MTNRTEAIEAARANLRHWYEHPNRVSQETGKRVRAEAALESAVRCMLDALTLPPPAPVAASERDHIRAEAFAESASIVEAYRDTKPRAEAADETLHPSQRGHAEFLRGCAAGERSALYSAACRLRSLASLPTPAPAVEPSEAPLTRKQAHALAMDILDGEEADDVHVSVRDGHEGPGWYASIVEYEEEGGVFLGDAGETKAAATLLAMEREMHAVTKRELEAAETSIGWAVRRIAEEGLDVTPKNADHKPLTAAVYAVVDHHAEHHRKLTALRAEVAALRSAPLAAHPVSASGEMTLRAWAERFAITEDRCPAEVWNSGFLDAAETARRREAWLDRRLAHAGPPPSTFVRVGAEVLIEAEHGAQTPGGPYTLLATIERFDADGIWAQLYADRRSVRVVAPFRVISAPLAAHPPAKEASEATGRYRRGLRRLVGNARCSECCIHQPALVCFDNAPDGSSGWMVCDDCLRDVLPAVDAPAPVEAAERAVVYAAEHYEFSPCMHLGAALRNLRAARAKAGGAQ